jgi:aspartyl/asparaginyl-tRNA synthetase
MQNLIINSHKFSYVVNKLRGFFLNKGFIEVHTQNRLSILAACEDPTTISTFNYANNVFPLPQTGQMWLEWEMLTNPKPPGYFCVSTSYRNEKNPVPGRHQIIFPMFEFRGPILPNLNNASTFENDSSISETEWKTILENMETYTQDNNKWQDTILYDNTWNKDNETEWEHMFRMNGM